MMMTKEEKEAILTEAYFQEQQFYREGYVTLWGIWRHRLAEWLLKGHRLLKHYTGVPEEEHDGTIDIRRN